MLKVAAAAVRVSKRSVHHRYHLTGNWKKRAVAPHGTGPSTAKWKTVNMRSDFDNFHEINKKGTVSASSRTRLGDMRAGLHQGLVSPHSGPVVGPFAVASAHLSRPVNMATQQVQDSARSAGAVAEEVLLAVLALTFAGLAEVFLSDQLAALERSTEPSSELNLHLNGLADLLGRHGSACTHALALVMYGLLARRLQRNQIQMAGGPHVRALALASIILIIFPASLSLESTLIDTLRAYTNIINLPHENSRLRSLLATHAPSPAPSSERSSERSDSFKPSPHGPSSGASWSAEGSAEASLEEMSMWKSAAAVGSPALVTAPVFEELFWRGLLFHRLLLRSSPLIAYALSSALFAGAHIAPVFFSQETPEMYSTELHLHMHLSKCRAFLHHLQAEPSGQPSSASSGEAEASPKGPALLGSRPSDRAMPREAKVHLQLKVQAEISRAEALLESYSRILRGKEDPVSWAWCAVYAPGSWVLALSYHFSRGMIAVPVVLHSIHNYVALRPQAQ
uniref:CAAX prenyl protease 2/Lysostaphin resistance protein A-like domain-containing protein n=1 Tax=Cyanoptyche gloeocystis TaxID=77922 RepID=A0A7S2NPE0_9EUKA|mmetsp:Transcript_2020/g.3793  ORF Transcript_2020/g.3793 Transcript_2020/m.3793 type:complete len:509 (+) Transcript_2020:28-1554(+)|eukprot:CAMPEP_0196662910 /NCGR_PEP_ID=MMETSP1086-20130531/50773_1 /TAXON_ID=77921 /ORGANISM="Cyanoptyche  gloeocystis , Strain SAG4.97" /LENGTH=508 /DNA_ID=CAMNT_0041998533 /DNA_START=27 /DNA_END=1553 /DNA_ORIENTATION=-